MVRRLLAYTLSTRGWKWVAKNIIGHLTFRVMSYPSFPMGDFFKILEIMRQPNTAYCFVSSDHASLASILIRKITGTGQFSHAGFVLPSDPKDTNVLHMLGNGPEVYHLLTLLRQVDHLGLVAVEFSPEDYGTFLERLSSFMEIREKFEYDFEQRMSNASTKLYCSELVWTLLDGLVKDPDFKPRKILGRTVFDPDAVIKIGKLVYTNHPDLVNLVEK